MDGELQDDVEYRVEFNVLDRVAFFHENPTYDLSDSVDKFKYNVTNVLNQIKNLKIVTIASKKEANILYYINNMSHVEYKNPIAYVLGFLCLMSNGEINSDKFRIIKQISELINFKINIEDIIRYCVLASDLLKNNL